MSDLNENTIRWERSDDGIVVLTLDDPAQSANTMNSAYVESMRAIVERLQAEKDQIKGVIITSGKKTFFAGGDLNALRLVTKENAKEFGEFLRDAKGQLRAIETLGVPVVAAINGAALGGGLEIALATHHRIIVDDPKAVTGFPEVVLGLLPGAGGVTRTVRMLGIAQALVGVLTAGQKRFKPAEAKEIGLVDEIVPTAEDLIPAAKRWIAEKGGGDPVQQPWDADKKYKIPGGTPSTPSFAANLPAFPANLRKQIKGANLPAPVAILSAAVEGAQVDFDHALEIESRYFIELATGQVSKNMIQAFWFDLNRVTGDRGRAGAGGGDPIERYRAKKVVILGAGMMGAAIAYVSAKAGIEVVLKDVSLEAAERGKQYSVNLVNKAIDRGRSTTEVGEELLARILPSDKPEDAAGADLVIEAVFEDPKIKEQVWKEIEPHVAADALLGSNTSTLPITGLAEYITRPEDFIGIHFFSPVDKMPLVELIRGEQTTDEATFKALDFVKQIGKTPIVVNDSRGFYTSRVIGTFINEGVSMLAEGVPPATIEQASSQAGYPAPVLQLSDELNMKLMRKIAKAAHDAVEAEGGTWVSHPAEGVIERMLDEFDRPGRLEGRGFYEYEDGKRTGLWSGLREAFPPVADPASLSLRDLEERMLFIESIESVRCFDEGVIESVADANIGSIMGIGYPPWTGGALQYINGYAGGLPGFVARARELAAQYGERFEPPASLVERAERGERYSDELVAAASA
jgi:3-hydroxyacyl-CoA dehydrogenase / enoyl-CoA hydratase / 3-hydroxybutyryl-CoA epimerase